VGVKRISMVERTGCGIEADTFMLIRLSPMIANRRVLPIASVKLGIGRRARFAADAVAIWADHAGAQLVQDLEGRLVATMAQPRTSGGRYRKLLDITVSALAMAASKRSRGSIS
jgi:hypothetical protein